MLFLPNFTLKEVETIRDVAKASMSQVKNPATNIVQNVIFVFSKYCVMKFVCQNIQYFFLSHLFLVCSLSHDCHMC